MLTAKVSLFCPLQVRVGTPTRTVLKIECPFPAPPVRATMRLKNLLTGERYVGVPGEYVPVTGCGVMDIDCETFWVLDYLGLFRRGIKQKAPCRVTVFPKEIPCELPKYSQSDAAQNGWKPKAGGFAENHELRQYRPGDELRLIHHKMSAKTGKLIYREPVVPMQQNLCLVMTLSGTPTQLNSKLGRLLWMGKELVNKEQAFELRCQTGKGLQTYEVTDLPTLNQMMNALLRCEATEGEWIPEGISGYHRIGGDL